MIGGIVKIVYPRGGSIVRETDLIYFKSVNDDINTIDSRIKQILKSSYSVSIYVGGVDDIDYTLEIHISGDKANILMEDKDEMHVTTEEAKEFLHEVFLRLREQSKQIC